MNQIEINSLLESDTRKTRSEVQLKAADELADAVGRLNWFNSGEKLGDIWQARAEYLQARGAK